MLKAVERVINEFADGQVKRYPVVVMDFQGNFSSIEQQLLQSCVPDQTSGVGVKVEFVYDTRNKLGIGEKQSVLAVEQPVRPDANLSDYYCTARAQCGELRRADIVRTKITGAFDPASTEVILNLARAHQKRQDLANQRTPLSEKIALGVAGIVFAVGKSLKDTAMLDYQD